MEKKALHVLFSISQSFLMALEDSSMSLVASVEDIEDLVRSASKKIYLKLTLKTSDKHIWNL